MEWQWHSKRRAISSIWKPYPVDAKASEISNSRGSVYCEKRTPATPLKSPSRPVDSFAIWYAWAKGAIKLDSRQGDRGLEDQGARSLSVTRSLSVIVPRLKKGPYHPL